MGCCHTGGMEGSSGNSASSSEGATGLTLLVSRHGTGKRTEAYRVGERVDGQYNGRWYRAKIARDNGDGTFTVTWEPDAPADAREKDFIRAPEKLRRPEASNETWQFEVTGGFFGEIIHITRARTVVLTVDRNHLLNTAIGPVVGACPEDLLPGRLCVRFKGEEGEDGAGGGGITRTFLTDAGKLLADTQLGLLLPAAGGHLQLSPLPGWFAQRAAEPDSVFQQPVRWCRLFGRLLGMALAHECPLGLRLAPSLCKQLLGMEPSFADLQFVPGLSSGGAGWHSSLRALLAHRATDLVEDDAATVRMESDAVDAALLGLEAVMPSRAEQTFEALVAHVAGAARAPQHWEGAANLAASLLREARTCAQREMALAGARDLLQGIAAARGVGIGGGTSCTDQPSDAEGNAWRLPGGVSDERCQACDPLPDVGNALRALSMVLRTLKATPVGNAGNDGGGGTCRGDMEALLQFLAQAPCGEGGGGEHEAAGAPPPDTAKEEVASEGQSVTSRTGSSSFLDPEDSSAASLMREVSFVQGPGVQGGEALSEANLRAFAEAVARKALTENLQPHLGAVVEEFKRVAPQRLRQGLTWKQLQDRISGQRLDPAAFVQEWRDRTTYQSCDETDESVRLWWGYVSECTAEALPRLFAWCTGFAAIPATAWKFQIKVVDDTRRCPTINTCMTDDPSVANRGVKMPTIYLPAYDSKATLARKMEWSLAGASAMHLH